MTTSKFIQALTKHWFLIGLVLVTIIAAIYPNFGKKNGIIHAEITISYIAVMIIFLISGLSLKTKALKEALLYARLIFVVQFLNLIAIPSIGWAVAKLLQRVSFDDLLAQGLIIALSCPTTISSNVLMTKAAGGNEAAALINAVLGSILGVFITPGLIILFLGRGPLGYSVNFQKVFINLGITVILPLFVGQIIRNVWPFAVETLQQKVSLPYINSSMLLLLVYSVFCDTFAAKDEVFQKVDVGSMVSIIFVDLVLFCMFSGMCFYVSRFSRFEFTKGDSVAIVMCGATKTVALGIPLINVIFEGNKGIGILSIPLLVYHAEQLLVGSILVTRFSDWIKDEKPQDIPLG